MAAKYETMEASTGLIAALLEAWNAHDADRVAAFHAPDYRGNDVSQAAPQCGPEGIRQAVNRYLQAFPDLHFTPKSTIIQGDQVALVWTAQGTHQGKLMNIPPTGRRITVQGTSLFTLQQGKVWRALYIWDVAGLLRALGLLPELS